MYSKYLSLNGSKLHRICNWRLSCIQSVQFYIFIKRKTFTKDINIYYTCIYNYSLQSGTDNSYRSGTPFAPHTQAEGGSNSKLTVGPSTAAATFTPSSYVKKGFISVIVLLNTLLTDSSPASSPKLTVTL